MLCSVTNTKCVSSKHVSGPRRWHPWCRNASDRTMFINNFELLILNYFNKCVEVGSYRIIWRHMDLPLWNTTYFCMAWLWPAQCRNTYLLVLYEKVRCVSQTFLLFYNEMFSRRSYKYRPRWPCDLRRRYAVAWFMGSLVWIPLRTWIFVSCVCVVWVLAFEMDR